MSCEKVTILIERSKEDTLSVKEILKLKLHLAMCPPCSKYSKLSGQLDSLLKGVVETEDDGVKLSEQKKQEILSLVKGFESSLT